MTDSVSFSGGLKRVTANAAVPGRRLLWIARAGSKVGSEEWGSALAGFEITSPVGLPDAHIVIAQRDVGCVLVSGFGSEEDQIHLVESLIRLDSSLPVIFWDREMSAAHAVRLARSGAYHCFGYADSPKSLRECLDRAVEDRRSSEKAQARSAESHESWRGQLIGESAPIDAVAEKIRLVGPRRCTVLISGESGTGKEIAARALHLASPRANRPMVAINCAALPENLLEAELFGHVKGAFTGAISVRVGRFEQASKGTLFLDEIGDMPLSLQPKLLRVLQEREVQRLGSSETIKVDVRVIAATNMDLGERVRQGQFREDLFYRLNVVPLHMPSLREREGDVPLLVRHFIAKICLSEGIATKRVTPECLERFLYCQWPGNVRQLENAVEMAVAMSGDREVLRPSDFGLTEIAPARVIPIDLSQRHDELSKGADFGTAVTQFELRMIDQALGKAGGNKTGAAELLGMKRTTLIMKLRSFENAGLRGAV